jgi:hypothetical protein
MWHHVADKRSTVSKELATAICNPEHEGSRFLWYTMATKPHHITAQETVMLKELTFKHDFDISTVFAN